MKKLILILMLILLPINVKAAPKTPASKFVIDCEETSFKELAEFSCRLSVTSAVVFDKISFEITVPEGLSLDDVRSNFDALWQLSVKGKTITATTKRKQFVTDTQEFGILLFQSMEAGEQVIEIKNGTLVNSDSDNTTKVSDVNQKITILSSDNRLKTLSVDNKTINNFDPLVTSYQVEITSNQAAVILTGLAADAGASITGLGTIALDAKQNEFVLPIYVKSATGINRVYLIHLTRQDAIVSEASAADIKITDDKKNGIDFKFNPSQYEYNIEVQNSVKTLALEVTLDNEEYSFVEKYGSRKINIIDGDNLVLIKIKDASGRIKTYVLKITRVLFNKSANCYLKALTIEGYRLNFNKRLKQYELSIKKSQKKLVINALPEHKMANVTIIGNENLKEGSVINILVDAENGSRLTYQLVISHRKLSPVFIVVALGIVTVGAGYFALKKKTKILGTQIKSDAASILSTPPAELREVAPVEETALMTAKGAKTIKKKAPAKTVSSTPKVSATKRPAAKKKPSLKAKPGIKAGNKKKTSSVKRPSTKRKPTTTKSK